MRGGSGVDGGDAVFPSSTRSPREEDGLRDRPRACSKISGPAGVTLDPGQLPTRAKPEGVGAGTGAESSKTSSRTSAGAAWGVGGDLALSASAGGVGGGCTSSGLLVWQPMAHWGCRWGASWSGGVLARGLGCQIRGLTSAVQA